MKELLSLNKYIYRYKWRLLLGSIFIIALNFFSIYSIRFVGKAVDFIKTALASSTGSDTSVKSLLFYGSLVIVLPMISGFLKFLMRQTIIVSSRHIEFDLKNDIFKHYLTLDSAFYKQNRVGDLMNRISEDVGYVRMYLGPGIMYPINLTALSAILIIEMLSIDKTMTAYTLLPLPFLTISVYLLSSRINKRSRAVQAEQSNLSAYVQDIFSGIRVIKSFNKTQYVSQTYKKKTKAYKKKSISLVNINAFFTPLMIVVIGVSQLVILYVGGMRYINGQIKDVGTLAQFFMYLNMLIWPFTSLGWVSMVIQRAEASMKRINEFLHTEPNITNTGSNTLEITGDINFSHVNFTYKNTGIQALKDISFHINSGDTLAILGKTGSGKTTITELLTRMYEPTSGKIFIDNVNIADYDLYSLRKQIGVVPQEAFLFSTSLKANLGFALDTIDDDLVKNYAKKSDIHDSILHFKEGYDTKVGERGVTLSGGQKQRVSIARALLKQPKILIFDDSLSAVDTETEERILENIKAESQDKTSIIVTHRVSSARHADKIIVLEKGQVIENGTHPQLIELNGSYAEMFRSQTEHSS